jgi:glutaredoxin
VKLMLEKSKVTLFTRKGCHLCEKAKEVIEELHTSVDFFYEEHDIDEKDEWIERYGLMIPVILIDSKEIQFGRIDRITVEKALLK